MRLLLVLTVLLTGLPTALIDRGAFMNPRRSAGWNSAQAASASNRSWYVNIDGTGDAPSIQAAIDSCVNGDSVIIGDGTYVPKILGLGFTDLDPQGRAIVIMAENGPGAVIIDCVADSFSSQKRGLHIVNGEGPSTVIDGLVFIRPTARSFPESGAATAGGGVLCANSSPTIRNCVFAGGGAIIGAGAYCYRSSATFINCTFAENGSLEGSGVAADSASSITLQNCIVIGGIGSEGLKCKRSSSATLACCDVYGNEGGDWVDCIAGQEGINGNFSTDPWFCDLAPFDYRLGDLSPCDTNNNTCGVLIGALEVGCVWCAVDSDGDGYGDPGNPENLCEDDNCPSVYNPDQIDADDDGWGAACDCVDTDEQINPNSVWYEDADGDGYGNPDTSVAQCDPIPGHVLDNNDCDDTDSLINPETRWYRDQDGDGYGTPLDSLVQCDQPDGYVMDNQDCNDGDPKQHPETRWFYDADGDFNGHTDSVIVQCAHPGGPYTTDSTDNCPEVWNFYQEDADGDAVGDSCDSCTDTDGDGAGNPGFPLNTCADDNCPDTPNPDQANADADSLGDACDPCTDTDGDYFGDPGYPNNTCPTDVCPSDFDPLQLDRDEDGVGDVCDNCPDDPNPDQADEDEDGIGDVCECNCPFQCDFDEDSFLTALDLSAIIDILFGGGPDVQDPNCPSPRADFDCDTFSTALDLSGLIDHLFSGGDGPCEPCNP